MGMIIKKWKLSSITKDFKVGLKDYSSLYFEGTPIKDYLINQSYVSDINSGRTPSRFNADYWGSDYEFITMSDVDTNLYKLKSTTIDCITEEAISSEKTLLQVPAGSLIISNAMTVGLSFIVDRPVYINQNVFWVNVDEKKISKKFLMWYMNCVVRKKFQSLFSSKYLSKQELSRIIIPNIELKKQKEFERKILPIEQEIEELERKIVSETEIVDEVFGSRFNYDYEKFNELKAKKNYSSSFSKYGNNIDVRFSAKFHRPAGEFVYQELLERPNIKIKKCICIPMITGQGIETTDYDDNGDYVYVSMADISTWKVNLDDIKNVSNKYAEGKKYKKVKGIAEPVSTEIRADDILMMRSGEGGIGKVAIVEDDIKGIFCDFIIRIRFDEKQINPLFAYYYFRTSYFQYLVEINKKGLGNNTNIFPNQIQELQIPYLSLVEQQAFIKKIKDELDKQKIIDKEIQNKKTEIECILSSVMK